MLFAIEGSLYAAFVVLSCSAFLSLFERGVSRRSVASTCCAACVALVSLRVGFLWFASLSARFWGG